MSALENLTPAGAATRLHYNEDAGELWLDTDIGDHDGICIAIGPTREAAIRDAIQELQDRLADLWMALTPKRESARPCGCDPGADHICDEHASEASR